MTFDSQGAENSLWRLPSSGTILSTPLAGVTRVYSLVTRDLPKRWSVIDQFEGATYKRRLITVDTNTGIAVANVYLNARQ